MEYLELLNANIAALQRQIKQGKIKSNEDIVNFFCRLLYYRFSTLVNDYTLFSIIEVMQEVKAITYILDLISSCDTASTLTHLNNLYPWRNNETNN